MCQSLDLFKVYRKLSGAFALQILTLNPVGLYKNIKGKATRRVRYRIIKYLPDWYVLISICIILLFHFFCDIIRKPSFNGHPAAFYPMPPGIQGFVFEAISKH